MKYYEKTIGNETFIMCLDDQGNYSVASDLDPDPTGFLAPVDPFARGYVESTRERATEILGYDPEE